MPKRNPKDDDKTVTPAAGESQSEFISRCIAHYVNSGYEQDQAAAICYDAWEGKDFSGGKRMRHVRIKSGDIWEDKELDSEELFSWFKDNTKDGAVLSDITLFADVQFKSVDGDSADWVLSDMSLDRDMERVDPAGADFKHYKQNPVVLWAHDYLRPAIGKMESPKVKDGQVVGKVRFDSRDNDPFAYMVGQKVKSGIISAGSIGFKPNTVEFVEDSKDPTRLVHRKWELMEFSICNVPSNYNALAQRAETGEDMDTKAEIEALDKRIKLLETMIEKKKSYVSELLSDVTKPVISPTEGGSETSAVSAMFGANEPSGQKEPDAFDSLKGTNQ